MTQARQIETGRLVNIYVAFVICLAAITFVLAAALDPLFNSPQGPPVFGIFIFISVGLILELAEHRLAVGAAGSIAFILYIGSALVFGPAWSMLVTGASVAGAKAISRRPPIKIAFNAAQLSLAIVAGSAAYMGFDGSIPPGNIEKVVLPFAGMVLSFFAVNSLLVSGVVAISERRSIQEIWLRNTWSFAAYDLVASTLGLAIAWLYVQFEVWGVAGVVAPILFIRHIYMVNVQLQATNREMLDVMVKAIEARDPYTSGHSQRVAEIARRLARELGLSFKETDEIATAALLHDVGKIYEEFAPLLRKPGRLTPEEFRLMQSHAARSAELVNTVSGLRGLVERSVRHHHENYDGSGYPDGLAGEAIPLGARIIMVADTTDAMVSHRPYRRALSYIEVVHELERYSGRQFDPVVVQAFKRSAAIVALVEGMTKQTQVAGDEPIERRLVVR